MTLDEAAEREEPGGVEASEEAARQICLRLLTATPKTRSELATALRKRGVPDRVAETVLSRFADVGLIDDTAFAHAWVTSRHQGRGLARRALAAELGKRGVAPDEVREAVATVSAEDEMRAARRLVAKRVPVSRGKPYPVRARQLAGMLARKGYPPGMVYEVVREALDADGDSGPEAWDGGAPLDDADMTG